MGRKLRHIKTRPTFALVVDGECEIWYLQMLKRVERSLVVNISPELPQKKSISDQFEVVKQLSEDYTKVFWVVDLDTIISQSNQAKGKTPKQYFIEARQQILRSYKNVKIIVNNPCLEFWFLLHFEVTSKYFDNCAKAAQQLKKNLGDYEKTEKFFIKDKGNDIYSKLKPQLSFALANSKKLAAFDPDNVSIGLAEMHLFFEAEEFNGYFINN
jgi:hypothetical protein